MIKHLLEKLLRGETLSTEEARDMMSAIMSGDVSEPQIAALLIALRMKGETVGEIAGFAKAMREHAVRISPTREGLVDTCGTGGDARHTFNISTAAALVAAAMGIPIAKHGNRAVSSQCGSADVLEALGVNIGIEPTAVARLIDRVGIGFLFAPRHHPAMKHVAPVRSKLGVRTVFNLLGPLANPAGVTRQLLGVFDPALTEMVCRVLGDLGVEKAFVVHGHDGTDEVSICADTQVSVLEDGNVRSFRFSPEEVGFVRARPGTITGGTARENAAHIHNILSGEDGPRLDAVLLNAGFVALLADRAATAAEGVGLARDAVESGGAMRKLEELRDVSQALGKEMP